MDLLLLLAVLDPVSTVVGTSGWVGAGLLGAVLMWVFFVHLPAKDKRDREKDELLVAQHKEHTATIAALIEGKDRVLAEQRVDMLKAIHEMGAQFTGGIKEQRLDAHAAVERVLRHCESQVNVVANGAMMKCAQSLDRVAEAIDSHASPARPDRG